VNCPLKEFRYEQPREKVGGVNVLFIDQTGEKINTKSQRPYFRGNRGVGFGIGTSPEYSVPDGTGMNQMPDCFLNWLNFNHPQISHLHNYRTHLVTTRNAVAG